MVKQIHPAFNTWDFSTWRFGDDDLLLTRVAPLPLKKERLKFMRISFWFGRESKTSWDLKPVPAWRRGSPFFRLSLSVQISRGVVNTVGSSLITEIFLSNSTNLWSSKLNLLDTRREGGGGARGRGRENLTLLLIINLCEWKHFNQTFNETCDCSPSEDHDHWARCCKLDLACTGVPRVAT